MLELFAESSGQYQLFSNNLGWKTIDVIKRDCEPLAYLWVPIVYFETILKVRSSRLPRPPVHSRAVFQLDVGANGRLPTAFTWKTKRSRRCHCKRMVCSRA